MSISEIRREVESIEHVDDVTEVADGVLRVEESKMVLLVQGGERTREEDFQGISGEVKREVELVDHVFVTVEGTLLLVEGPVEDPSVSYVSGPSAAAGPQDIVEAIEDLSSGNLRRKSLDTRSPTDGGSDNTVGLLESVLRANLSRYYTPERVAELVARWVTGGGPRESVLNVACGSGRLLKTVVEEIEDPEHALGVDINETATTIARGRMGKSSVEDPDIWTEDFFDVRGRLSVDRQTTLSGTESPPPDRGFDCVVAHPPVGVPPSSNEDQVPSSGPFRRLEHGFVNGACKALAESGRGCFLLARSSVQDLEEKVLPESVRLVGLIDLPESLFPVTGPSPVLALVERSSRCDEMVLVKISSLDDTTDVLAAVHHPEVESDEVSAVRTQTDLSSTTVQTLLREPGAEPFLAGDLPQLEDVTEGVATGTTTGSNELFYFDRSEREESDIHDRFFTPVIDSTPDRGSVGDDDIGLFLFDLRDFVEEKEVDPRDVDSAVSALDGQYPSAAEYVDNRLRGVVRESPRGQITPRSVPMTNPDLVTSSITSDVTWHRVDVDAEEVLYHDKLQGISCGSGATERELRVILNNPLYRRLGERHFPVLEGDYVRVQIGPLCQLPVLTGQLSEEGIEELDELDPLDDSNPESAVFQKLVERVDGEYTSAVSAAYDALSPPNTLVGYNSDIDELKPGLSGDTAEGIDFELVNDDIPTGLNRMFRATELFGPRERLIDELHETYTDDLYRSFVSGVAPQFEGVLKDYIKEAGGEVEKRETDEGNLRYHYRYRGDWKLLRLKILIDDFFDGDLSDVMQGVREYRNRVAHGRSVEGWEGTADALLFALFVLSHRLLIDYRERHQLS